MARQKNDGRGRMGGRQKGTPNKVNAKLQNIIADFCMEHFNEIQEKWAEVNPKDALQFYLKLLRFTTPYPQPQIEMIVNEEEIERRVQEKREEDSRAIMADYNARVEQYYEYVSKKDNWKATQEQYNRDLQKHQLLYSGQPQDSSEYSDTPGKQE